MKPLGEEVTHYWLVQRMAKATGADLSEAFKRGDLSSETWADMVHRCRGCAWAGACDGWLDAQEGSAEAPDTCLNKAVFERLAEPT